jgi:hypothetical protein
MKTAAALPEIVRIRDRGAEGPCAARNAALRSAGTPWVFLIDEDAHPAEGCLENLWEAAQADPAAAIVSPRILREDGSLDYDGGRAHFLGELCLESSGETAVATTALLIHRERALRAGLFDEDLVFFREDLSFSLRVRAAGWTIRRCPDAVVHHRRAFVRGVLHARRTYFQTRNRWRIMLEVLEARTLLRTLPLQLAYEGLNFGLALSRGEVGQWASALIAVARELPEIRGSRKSFQKRRAISDEILLGAPPLGWRSATLSLPFARRLKQSIDRLCRLWWGA